MKKFIYILSALVLSIMCACTPETTQVPEEVEETVTFSFSPYTMTNESITRTTTSIADIVTMLDVWFFEDDTEIAAVHQTSTDENFGTFKLTLNKTKTYTMYAIAHRAASAATLEDDIITFPDNKITQSFFYTTEFSPTETTSLSCIMDRIVGKFVLSTTDAVPNNVAKFRFTVKNANLGFNLNGHGDNNVAERTVIVNLNSRNSDGSASMIIYIIPDNLDVEETFAITVEALDENNEVIDPTITKTFNVPIRSNYVTTYRGTFFTSVLPQFSFLADEWVSYDPTTY